MQTAVFDPSTVVTVTTLEPEVLALTVQVNPLGVNVTLELSADHVTFLFDAASGKTVAVNSKESPSYNDLLLSDKLTLSTASGVVKSVIFNVIYCVFFLLDTFIFATSLSASPSLAILTVIVCNDSWYRKKYLID